MGQNSSSTRTFHKHSLKFSPPEKDDRCTGGVPRWPQSLYALLCHGSNTREVITTCCVDPFRPISHCMEYVYRDDTRQGCECRAQCHPNKSQAYLSNLLRVWYNHQKGPF